MIDISKETKRVIAEKDYILDSSNFYDIQTDKIHLAGDNFNDPFILFTLLHEIAHRYQVVLLKVDKLDIPELELEANRIAFDNLMNFGIRLSKRTKRLISKRL